MIIKITEWCFTKEEAQSKATQWWNERFEEYSSEGYIYFDMSFQTDYLRKMLGKKCYRVKITGVPSYIV